MALYASVVLFRGAAIAMSLVDNLIDLQSLETKR